MLYNAIDRNCNSGFGLITLSLLSVILTACGSLKDSPKYQLSDDVYDYRERGSKYQKAWIYVKDDTITALSYVTHEPIIKRNANSEQLFLKKSFDVDVMTVGFKYRSARLNLPRQLTTDFNGNVFLGYRIDRFTISNQQTPLGIKRTHKHRAIAGGVFGGIGSSAINPSTTNNKIQDDYSGFVFMRGAALLVGINSLTVGLGIGWDYLNDRDKDVWNYQNKPWYGLTIGLNLN